MSTTKRLLSVTLAIAMIILSAFSAFAEDTTKVVEPLSGTVAAGEVTVELADTEVTEVTVPVTITFTNSTQVSPHGQFDISATGATLKSAAFKTSDNSNFTPDETVPDGAGLVDKSIYVDADGVNTANGRVVVESDVSEGKQPSVSYVTVDVVLEFATALTAGQVIDVVISNIAATNLSEAPWTGMSAVNGKITVTAAEPECDHSNAVTKYDATQHWTECDCGNVSEKVDHGFTSEVAVAATETSSGIMRYTCECGYSYDDVIAATGAESANPIVFNSAESNGNTMSLETTSYTFGYDYVSGDAFSQALKAAGKGNRTVSTVLTIDGTEFILPFANSDSVPYGNDIVITGFSVDQYYQNVTIALRVVNNTTGDVYTSNTFAVNPLIELTEDYVAGDVYADKEAEVVAAFIDLSDMHANETNFNTYTAIGTQEVAEPIEFNSASSEAGNTVCLKNTSYTFGYDYVSGDEFSQALKAAGKGNRTVSTVLTIDGTEFILPFANSDSVPYGNDIVITGFSLDQFNKTVSIALRVVNNTTGDVYTSNTLTVNPGAAIIGDTELSIAYLDYQALWATCYN